MPPAMPRASQWHQTCLSLLPAAAGVPRRHVWGQAGTARRHFHPCLREQVQGCAVVLRLPLCEQGDPACDLSALSLPSLSPCSQRNPRMAVTALGTQAGWQHCFIPPPPSDVLMQEGLSCGKPPSFALTQLHPQISSSPWQMLQALRRVLPTLLSCPRGAGTTGHVCSAGKGQPPHLLLRWSQHMPWDQCLVTEGPVSLCLSPLCHLSMQVSGPGSELAPRCTPRGSSAGMCPPRCPPAVHRTIHSESRSS